MIDDSAPHCVFKIDELTRLIARQLIPGNRESARNFACACRYLEEPVLSVLWKSQESPCTLLETLPGDTWGWGDRALTGRTFTIVGDPSPEAWSRVHRYASWMCHVCLDGRSTLGEEAYRKLRLNAPVGGWFPALEGLIWDITRSNLPHLGLFSSPNLKSISISMAWGDSEVPQSSLQVIASTISSLPTSALQLLSVKIHDHRISRTYFKDSLSSVVLRCGPSLTEFSSWTPLSDPATNHLIHLPYLCTWYTLYPPPDYSASSPPLAFPPLIKLTIGYGVSRGWLSLFKRLGARVSSAQSATPLARVRESLRTLDIAAFPDPIIDSSFTSVIQTFRNLAYLIVAVVCCNGQCVFNLNNDDVAELAMALPRLEFLLLGYPCDKNTCATTVACLLPLSVRCARLQSLWIHFNTMNIVDDIKTISEDPRFQGLRSLRKCALSCLNVHKLPLTLDGSELETLARGMTDIFPNLECCDGWDEFNSKLAEVQG